MTLVVPGQTIRYRAYDLVNMTYIGDLPFKSGRFGQRLNVAGTFAASLPLADPRVRTLSPLTATQPSRTALFVDVNGVLRWGGILWTRKYSRSSHSLELGGNELWSYFDHRVQARDYSVDWATTPTDPLVIAKTVIEDAIAVPGSALSGMAVVLDYQSPTSPENFITTTYPIAQLQTVAQIVSTLAGMGYGVGFDYAIDVAYVAGVPTPTLTLSYPRRGHIFDGVGDAVLDVGPSYDYTYPEDGTKQANRVYLTSNVGNTSPQTSVEDPSSWAAGFPLLEEVTNFPQVNTVDVLTALAAGELATHRVPPVTPVVDVDPFGPFALGEFTCGDDVRFMVPDQVAVGDVADERFPGGQDGRF